MSIIDFKNTWMAKANAPAIFISATKNEGVTEFRQLLYDKVKEMHLQRYPNNHLLY
jgi:GTP-binding protein HflX